MKASASSLFPSALRRTQSLSSPPLGPKSARLRALQNRLCLEQESAYQISEEIGTEQSHGLRAVMRASRCSMG
ncbi:hypothetical protein CCHR01_07895 [Colletotrichum chrysophilum]|uniref:Uncharacterized protein n=1 Tax=Colletotrichum chrysophilum TaxID=1836956 RepID=A0AAD9EIC3_9PEZI|nr:hypothetical protein CCHR01_07895 [Colletotrichum chrysophilum]